MDTDKKDIVAVKRGVVAHFVVVGPAIACTYNYVSSEVGEAWFVIFFLFDTVSTVLLWVPIALIANTADHYVTPEPYKALAILLLFVGGSCQWAVIFAIARRLWTERSE